MKAAPARQNARARWVAVLIWAGVIFAGSSRPGSTIPGGYSVQGHLGEYFVFGALLCWALIPRRTAGVAIASALVMASLYGMTDEFHQRFVVMRTPDVTDWGLDTIGAFAGAVALALALTWFARVRRARAERSQEPGLT